MTAEEAVQEDPEAWDMLITDQVMPHMTGTELVAAVKKLRPDIPCIICTAYPFDVNEVTARQAGPVAFTTKPLDLCRFSALVAETFKSST